MKALSVKPEWAWLICAGMPIDYFDEVPNQDGSVGLSIKEQITVAYKDIENRNWQTEYRGRIYIHASKRNDKDSQMWLLEKGFAPIMVLMLYSKAIPRGAIIGEVDLVDCVTENKSIWFTGKYGFVLANPQLYEKPIPYPGRLGLFNVTLPYGDNSRKLLNI